MISRAARCGLALGFAWCLAILVMPASFATADTTTASPSFFADRAVVWVDRSQVLAFELDQVAESDRLFQAELEGDAQIEVLRQPMVLAGHSIGYLRLKVTGPGVSKLSIGQASITLEAKQPPNVEPLNFSKPKIISPVDYAIAWGKIGISAEIADNLLMFGQDRPNVRLRLPDGSLIEPVEQTKPIFGPTRRFGYEIDLDRFEPGPVELIPQAVDAQGRVTPGEPLVIQVIATPSADQLIIGEAEAHRDQERPLRYYRDEKPLRIARSDSASGQAYVDNPGANPPLTIPLEVEQPGWYQLILTASGTDSQATLPSIGLRLDDDNQPRTGSTIALTDWHRSPIGRPLHLKPGQYKLVTRYENDYRVNNHADRNLRIDRYEILKLGDGSGDGPLVESPHQIAMTSEWQDREISGQFSLTTLVGGTGLDRPVSQVDLWVNNKLVQTQHNQVAAFTLDRADLKPGKNTLQAVATRQGVTATTPEIQVELADHPAPPTRAQARIRLFAGDPRWSDLGKTQTILDKKTGSAQVLAFYSNTAAVAKLPDDWTGTHGISVRARSQNYKGVPQARLTLIADGQRTDIKTLEINGNYRSYYIGGVDLPPGPKQLEIAFINDATGEKANQDRNLFIDYVQIAQSAGKDAAPPAVHVLYPSAAGHSAYEADAVVVELADNQEVRTAGLLLDGEPHGPTFEVGADARVALPLILRDVEPGEYELSVVATDRAGLQTASSPQTLTVLDDPPAEPSDYELALRLLDRFGYGPTPRELADVLVAGRRDYLNRHLRISESANSLENTWNHAKIKNSRYDDFGGNINRALVYLNQTDNPLRARLVLFIDNHFNTWQRKTQAFRKAVEFENWVLAGQSPFVDLLMLSATSPAMLRYLDQNSSFNRRINENYAREIMELHTLGVHGGYSQNDVTQLAHMLTGWGTGEKYDTDYGRQFSAFRFVPQRNDPVGRDIIGQRFFPVEAAIERYDRIRFAIETLASHPSTARYLSQKLIEHYVQAPAPEALIDKLAAVYHRTGGSLAEMVFALAESDELMQADRQIRVAHPIGFGVRLARSVEMPNPYPVRNFAASSGFGMFDRETPDGYPEEDEAYADSNAMLQRWRFSQQIESHFSRVVPKSLQTPPKDATEQQIADWHQQLIDFYAVRLTGRLLSERSNQAVMQVLSQTSAEGIDAVRFAGTLVAQMPELSLR
jgi:uncharacterized protein (DUF1800 family)